MTSALSVFATTLPSYYPPGSGWIGNWTPGIGDPTFIGWFTVIAYFTASLACFRLQRRLFKIKNKAPLILKEQKIWGMFALILFCLCLNKQLDLQTAMTEFFREMALDQGWYRIRFLFQVAFIAALTLALPVSGWYVYRFSIPYPQAVKRAGMGLGFIAFFILIRAASFHHIDRLLGSDLIHIRLNWIFELGGIGVIHWSARQRKRELRRPIPR